MSTEELVRYAPDLGRHEGNPEAVYHMEWLALNHSTLKKMRVSPLQAQWVKDHPTPPTPAQEFGSAAHCIVLEGPEKFFERYKPAPGPSARYVARATANGTSISGWKNTKEFKELKFDIEEDGYTCISAKNFEGAQRLNDNLWNRAGRARDLAEILTASEVSYVVKDEATGLLCKIRVDLEAYDAGVHCDMKTTRNAEADKFSRQMAELSYHTSGVFYDRILGQQSDHWNEQVFLVVESHEPFDVIVYNMVPRLRKHAAGLVDTWMQRYAECLRTDVWEGYPNTVQSIDIPPWAYTADLPQEALTEGGVEI